MLNVGPWELMLVLGLALLVVGPGKLPQLGSALGKSLREFRRATRGLGEELEEAASVKEESKAV